MPRADHYSDPDLSEDAVSDHSDEEIEEPVKSKKKAAKAPKKKSPKKPKVEDSDDEPVVKPKKKAAKAPKKKSPKKKPVAEPEVEDSDDEPVAEPAVEDSDDEPAAEPEVEDSDDEPAAEPEVDDSDDEPAVKPKKKAAKAPKKKSPKKPKEEDSDEDAAEKPKKSPKKVPRDAQGLHEAVLQALEDATNFLKAMEKEDGAKSFALMARERNTLLRNIAEARAMHERYAKKTTRKSTKKDGPKRAPCGIMLPMKVSTEAFDFVSKVAEDVGVEAWEKGELYSRVKLQSMVSKYINHHKIKDPDNGKFFVVDETLAELLSSEEKPVAVGTTLRYCDVGGYIGQHFTKEEKKE